MLTWQKILLNAVMKHYKVDNPLLEEWRHQSIYSEARYCLLQNAAGWLAKQREEQQPELQCKQGHPFRAPSRRLKTKRRLWNATRNAACTMASSLPSLSSDCKRREGPQPPVRGCHKPRRHKNETTPLSAPARLPHFMRCGCAGWLQTRRFCRIFFSVA